MLSHVQIRDFAIIDSVELELESGLTVLTGETGAGKSILVDALLLAVGGRSGPDSVRHGAERAEISAVFTLADAPTATNWLAEQAIEHDGECALRRTVGADGRSRAWVNGQSMPIQAVRQLGELLLDVHGQMEYQSLVRRPAQRQLLDMHGRHARLVADTAAAWRVLKALEEERAAALATAQDRGSRLELLEYHVAELNALDLKPGEPAALLEERERLTQHGRLVEGAREILLLTREADEGNAEQALARASSLVRSLVAIDPAMRSVAELIDEALISVREAVTGTERYLSTLDADASRQEWLETRLAAIEAVARKHRTEPAALERLREELSGELHELQTLEVALDDITERVAAAERRFLALCEELTAARRSAARTLSESVTESMQGLGMPGGHFEVRVDSFEPAQASEHGRDAIEFLVSANPGQPSRALAKVASGGELSRISLAIQVAALEGATLPCLVFDEVDAGVGGAVAEIVGRQLRTLAARSQVLCVTHLPQVASQAHQHIRVAKLTDGRSTRTLLQRLDPTDRIEEIARMLGGIEITGAARDHAREMLGDAPASAGGAMRPPVKRRRVRS